MDFGKTIKDIRKNKGYTQVFTSRDIISQSSYSKFEKGESDINSVTFFKLLQRLELTTDEFFFLYNGYRYSDKSVLIQRFFTLPYNNPQSIRSLKELIIEYLGNYPEDRDSILLNDILLICDALKVLSDENNTAKAQAIVKPIWNRISKRESWFVIDIKIINTILYFFELEVAIEITKTVLKKIVKYKGFNELGNLEYAIKVNLSLLFIKSKKYNNALVVIEEILKNNLKILPYHILAVCLLRREICKQKLKMSSDKEDFNKAILLTDIYNDEILKEFILNEFNFYTNE